MHIVGKSLKDRAYKLMLDNLDDLWHLYNLIEAHDIVSGGTYRRLEKPGDKLRPDKAVKKRVWLAIDVESVEFHEFSNRLRVHGTIVKGPEDMNLKTYHTLNFNVGDKIGLEKPEDWRPHQLEQLHGAVEAAQQPQVIIIAIEDDNAVITLMHQYGIRPLASIQAQGMGKLYTGAGTSTKKGQKQASEVKSNFFEEIILQLNPQVESAEKTERSPLIVVGPGFTKDEFVKYYKNKHPRVFTDILLETTGQAGMVGVHEALRRGVVRRLVENSRVAFEVELVDKILEGIATNGAVSYGLEETKSAVAAGAVETVLVIDKLVRAKDEQLENLLSSAEGSGGKVVVVSTVHDAGKQLEALGGVAALLRYKI